jgi:hypothetical protein
MVSNCFLLENTRVAVFCKENNAQSKNLHHLVAKLLEVSS